jgi:hypothetical protein
MGSFDDIHKLGAVGFHDDLEMAMMQGHIDPFKTTLEFSFSGIITNSYETT